MDAIWNEMYAEAKKVLNPRQVSAFVEVGGVAAAVQAGSGKIYTGICVDTACSIGLCAERNAIFHMLTCGESTIQRVVAINWNGKAMPPCGVCRELMAQLMPGKAQDVEVMLDYEMERIVKLADLMPDSWL